jgi:hypothetical protein
LKIFDFRRPENFLFLRFRRCFRINLQEGILFKTYLLKASLKNILPCSSKGFFTRFPSTTL